MPGNSPFLALKIAHVGFYGQWQNASLPLWKDEGDGGIQPIAACSCASCPALRLWLARTLPLWRDEGDAGIQPNAAFASHTSPLASSVIVLRCYPPCALLFFPVRGGREKPTGWAFFVRRPPAPLPFFNLLRW